MRTGVRRRMAHGSKEVTPQAQTPKGSMINQWSGELLPATYPCGTQINIAPTSGMAAARNAAPRARFVGTCRFK